MWRVLGKKREREKWINAFRAAISEHCWHVSLHSPLFLRHFSQNFLSRRLKTKTHKIASSAPFLLSGLKIDHQQRLTTITVSENRFTYINAHSAALTTGNMDGLLVVDIAKGCNRLHGYIFLILKVSDNKFSCFSENQEVGLNSHSKYPGNYLVTFVTIDPLSKFVWSALQHVNVKWNAIRILINAFFLTFLKKF